MQKLTEAQTRVLNQIKAEGVLDHTSGVRFQVVQRLWLAGLVDLEVVDGGRSTFDWIAEAV